MHHGGAQYLQDNIHQAFNLKWILTLFLKKQNHLLGVFSVRRAVGVIPALFIPVQRGCTQHCLTVKNNLKTWRFKPPARGVKEPTSAVGTSLHNQLYIHLVSSLFGCTVIRFFGRSSFSQNICPTTSNTRCHSSKDCSSSLRYTLCEKGVLTLSCQVLTASFCRIYGA